VDDAQPRGDLSAGPWEVLKQGLGTASGVTTAFIGKVGLALSGGGFRAALFHIGVLARLAELDVLRHVEVISCVSGGSIVGAYYYLELRHLLQTKADEEITRQDYIEIVQRIQREFLAGIQRNIRTRVLANPVANIRMLLFPNESRTERVGELYEKYLFSRVHDGKQGQARWINDLTIQPEGEKPGFNPKSNNWRRRVKAPILILNATTLNTGHNWQFTATWMGEPPAGIDSEIDANNRLRRMYYYEAPEGYRQYRLGHAVAASSCVPGLFEAINLPNLFPDKTVRLVTVACTTTRASRRCWMGCSVLLVSGASGQMEDQNQPGNSALSALLRSNSILQSRVREAEFHELDSPPLLAAAWDNVPAPEKGPRCRSRGLDQLRRSRGRIRRSAAVYSTRRSDVLRDS
jgi:predicted acylesterase/phospholipase RssA